MKFTIVVLLCVLVFVEQMSAAPTKDKKKSEKKDKTSDKSLNKKKDTTEKKEKKQYIPGMTSTSYGSPYDSTYSTGYAGNPAYNTGASQVDQQQQEEVFNSPVKLVQIKDLNIKNGVIKQSNVVEG